MPRTLLAALLLALAPAAWAQDADDLPEAGDPDTRTAPRTAPEDDLPESGEPDIDDDGELDLGDEEEEEEVFFDDEEDTTVSAPRKAGEDTAQIYRQTQTELLEASAEERLSTWEEYLQTYPNTAFLEQISKEIALAEEELYGEGIGGEVSEITYSREIPFPELALGENLNPATRLKFGFDFGLPAWISLIADAEYALTPHLSGRLGVRKRLTGWSVEAGPRLAVVKDTKSGLILTVAADAQVGADPALFAARPGLLVGWRPIDSLYIQAQGSAGFESASGTWSPRYRGAGGISFRAADPVAIYAEGMLEAKYLGWPGGAFQFHRVVFGMRFYPAKKNEKREDNTEVLIGASVPALYNYWDIHKGAATAQVSHWLE